MSFLCIRQDSNLRPLASEANALSSYATDANFISAIVSTDEIYYNEWIIICQVVEFLYFTNFINFLNFKRILQLNRNL